VKAQKTNYDSSDYTIGSTGCLVYLVCGKPASLTVPAANSTGTFVISWSASDVIGATYILEQSKDGGTFTAVYSDTNTSANITVTANGTYTYRVKAQKPNYVTSDYTIGSTGCLVYLVCGKPASLTVPATNSTGTFVISWSASNVSDVTYIVEQSKDGGTFTEVSSGTNTSAYITVTTNGSYTYRVKAQKSGYDASDWTNGSTTCAVMILSKVKITVSNQPDLFFATISSAISGMPNGASVVLNTWKTTFIENIDLDKLDTILTIGSAFDPSYTILQGPTVIQGNVQVTSGTLVVENLVIL
jgi:plastocyanin